MKAVIYARFNSQNQVENSIEKQIKICEEYAKEKGYTIVNKYIDTSSREQFEQMIKDIAKKQVQVILVYSIDIFATNTFDSAIYKNRLKKDGVSGILVESIVEAMAEYQSMERRNKIKAGIERTKKEREEIVNEG